MGDETSTSIAPTGLRGLRKRSGKILERVFLVAFIGVWLVPVAHRGIVKERPISIFPKPVTHVQNVACLFRRNVDYWSEFYVAGRLEGEGGFFEMESKDFSPMQPFGYKTRVDYIISDQFYAGEHAMMDQHRALAEWYKRRYDALHPGEAPLAEVRLIEVRVPVGRELSGRWRTPNLEKVPEEQQILLYYRNFAE